MKAIIINIIPAINPRGTTKRQGASNKAEIIDRDTILFLSGANIAPNVTANKMDDIVQTNTPTIIRKFNILYYSIYF